MHVSEWVLTQTPSRRCAEVALALLVSVFALACQDDCPSGYVKAEGICRRPNPSGVNAPNGTAAVIAGAQGVTTGSPGNSAGSAGAPRTPMTVSGTAVAGAPGANLTAMPNTSVAGTGSSAPNVGVNNTVPMAGASSPVISAGANAMSMMSTNTGPCPAGQVPQSEECDGQDNDCDGKVDEQIMDMDCGSSSEGICKKGKQRCVGGTFTACEGAVEPQQEVCDAESLDENCNGMGNEGCTCTPGQTKECGMDRGACKKGMQTCTADAKWSMDCAGAVTPQKEICDGANDEDCDGQPDETDSDCQCINGKSESCTAGKGICMMGSRTCNSGKWSSCMPMMQPTSEKCDGIDTDCNGEPDNGATCPSPQVCNSNGRCGCKAGTKQDCKVAGAMGPCAKGSQTCGSGGDWGECASTFSRTNEVCDGIDNNCSGTTDEGDLCNGRACVKNGSKATCAKCSEATASADCQENNPCKKPACGSDGQCNSKPMEELWPCARPGQFEGFCRSGTCSDPPSANGKSRMNAGERLLPNERLVSGDYFLICQYDGNLVLYRRNTMAMMDDVLWASNSDKGNCGECVMQPDGNLVVYQNPPMTPIWASNTETAGTIVGNYLELSPNSLKIVGSKGKTLYP